MPGMGLVILPAELVHFARQAAVSLSILEEIFLPASDDGSWRTKPGVFSRLPTPSRKAVILAEAASDSENRASLLTMQKALPFEKLLSHTRFEHTVAERARHGQAGVWALLQSGQLRWRLPIICKSQARERALPGPRFSSVNWKQKISLWAV